MKMINKLLMLVLLSSLLVSVNGNETINIDSLSQSMLQKEQHDQNTINNTTECLICFTNQSRDSMHFIDTNHITFIKINL
jgi:hypothetical protein